MYLVLLSLSLAELFTDVFENRILKEMLFYLMIVFLIIIAGIRFEVGTDFTSYYNIFRRLDSIASDAAYNYLEFGFRLITVFFKSLGFSPYFLFIVFSTVMYIFLARGILKSSNSPFLTLFLFVLIFMIGYLFNVLRQGIAMSVLIYLIPDIKEKRYIKVVLFTILAASFHSTGYIILLCYVLFHFPLKFSLYIIGLLVSIIYYFNAEMFFYQVSRLLTPSMQHTMMSYVERFPGGVGLTSYLLRVIVIVSLLIFFNDLKEKDNFLGLFNIYFIGFLIYTLLSFQGQAATRVNMFFRISEILLLPYLLTVKDNPFFKLFMFIFVISIGTLIFGMDLTREANYPFQFYWQF